MASRKMWIGIVGSTLTALLLFILVPLMVRRFIVEAFVIPSGAMAPTVVPGDHVFVKKWVGASAVRAGDVIVFRFPEQREQDFLFRVVARGGQSVELRDSHVVVDGKPLPFCLVGTALSVVGEPVEGEVFVEWLDGRAHLAFFSGNAPPRAFGPFVVPAGELFVVGDNRNNSRDSAEWFSRKGGGVPFDDVKGLVSTIWSSPQSERIGRSVADAPTLPTAWRQLESKFANCLKRGP